MKAIMVLFDSLNRHFLPNYGCEWTKLPNFIRLGEHSVTFDNFYAGSMPCMPARRELHTGRYNFLHRSWSPMEPYDESVFCNLRKKGVYSHITTDHFHYWEDGGSCYLSKYDSFEINRGQQGDPWIACVEKPYWPETLSKRTAGANWRHDWANRAYLDSEEKMPVHKTFKNGLHFIDDNHGNDSWLLQIEAFDPHEPFYSLKQWKDLYPHDYAGKQMDWPDYGKNELDCATTKHVRYEYASLLSMCDYYLGKLMDKMDEYGLWDDTMLIVNTDHGFMLGEKEWMGKNVQPMYSELCRLPFFIHDPRHKEKDGTRCQALCQTIDIPVTLCEYFGADSLLHAQGVSLEKALMGTSIHEYALFGVFGGHVNITDGRYVYMRSAVNSSNTPLYEYTLMPCHMSAPFSTAELKNAMLVDGFSFTDGLKMLKVEARGGCNSYWYGSLLYDLQNDPDENESLECAELEVNMCKKLRDMLILSEAPKEQFQRLGIPFEGNVDSSCIMKGSKKYDKPEVEGITLSSTAEKTLAIYLSMLVTEVQKNFIRHLEKKYAGRTVDEEDVFNGIRDVENPRFMEATIKTIRNVL